MADFFWTDATQAQERLHNTVVLYDDIPCYVAEIVGGFEDGVPRAVIHMCNAWGTPARKRLDSPKFSRFRSLPQLGFMNRPESRSVYMFERIAVRTRSHGLANNNTRINMIYQEPNHISIGRADRNLTQLLQGEDFLRMHKGEYPNASEILSVLDPGSALAYSRNYVIIRDTDGLRWLYRGNRRIGFFPGVDTLNLFQKSAFYREEIMEDENFNINTIQEF